MHSVARFSSKPRENYFLEIKHILKNTVMKIILEGDGYGDSCIPEPCKNKEWFAEHICIYANAAKYTFI